MSNPTHLLKSALTAVLAEILDDLTLTLRFSVEINQAKFIGAEKMIINTEQFVTATFQPLTAGGNAARIDGIPTVESSDPNVATAALQEDGSIRIDSVGLGQCLVTVKADADLDEGEIREITGALDITVVEPEAVQIVLSAGEPQQK